MADAPPADTRRPPVPDGALPLPALARLSRFSAAVLVSGHFVIIACCSFVTFLWFGNEAGSVWKQIVISGWVVRSVTLTALIIRFVVGMQVACCVAMLASLLLETSAVSLAAAPAMSMMTANGAGVVPFLMNCFGRGSLRRGNLFRVIAVMMTAVFGLLQFTSTILLSDIGRGVITVGLQDPSTPFSVSSEAILRAGLNGHYVYQKPIFPAFAELSEKAVKESWTDRVVDTGTTLRAFLPINDSRTRQDIREYSGPGTVIDNRVMCTRPNIQNPSFYKESGVNSLALTGELRVSTTIQDDLPPAERFKVVPQIYDNIPFLCSLPLKIPEAGRNDTGHVPLSICLIRFDPVVGGIVSIMQEFDDKFDPGDQVSAPLAFLVVSTEGYDGWDNAFSWWAENSSTFSAMEDVGVWARVDTEWKNSSALVSLCYTSLAYHTTEIHASRNGGTAFEPSSKRNGTLLDTSDIRHYFGAGDTKEPAKRGLFDLGSKPSWLAWKRNGSQINDDGLADGDISASVLEYLTLLTNNGSDPKEAKSLMMGDLKQISFRDYRISGTVSAVFSDTLRESGNLAKAVQSFITMQLSLSYYDYLDYFDKFRPSSSVVDYAVTRPVGQSFFFLFVAGIALHLVLVLLIAALFVIKGRWTTLGSSWQCLAHLSSPDVQGWVGEKDIIRNDKQVNKEIRRAGFQEELVGLVESEEGVRVMRHGRTTQADILDLGSSSGQHKRSRFYITQQEVMPGRRA